MPVQDAPISHCPVCRYDLTGLPSIHRCPECGFEYDDTTRVYRGRVWSPLERWTRALGQIVTTLCFCLMIWRGDLRAYRVPVVVAYLGVVGVFMVRTRRGPLGASTFLALSRNGITYRGLTGRVESATWPHLRLAAGFQQVFLFPPRLMRMPKLYLRENGRSVRMRLPLNHLRPKERIAAAETVLEFFEAHRRELGVTEPRRSGEM